MTNAEKLAKDNKLEIIITSGTCAAFESCDECPGCLDNDEIKEWLESEATDDD